MYFVLDTCGKNTIKYSFKLIMDNGVKFTNQYLLVIIAPKYLKICRIFQIYILPTCPTILHVLGNVHGGTKM